LASKQLLFQFLVDILGAADEAHRRHTETVLIEPAMRSRDQLRMIGEAEVVIGAQVDQVVIPALGVNAGALRRYQRAFLLVQPLLANIVEHGLDIVDHIAGHRHSPHG